MVQIEWVSCSVLTSLWEFRILCSHPGMVCLCGRTIYRHLSSLLNHNSWSVSLQNWQQFPRAMLYTEIAWYQTFGSMIDSLLREESHPAVLLLRSDFVGHLDLVKVAQQDQGLAKFLTAEGVLLMPDVMKPYFRM